ncbi:hypothetical protein [Photobacterium leiognathi]|uniref:hypothetical protein n=1 Tax=Photobacterium leiognathi TaxID=553611 RepID=UPI00273924C8|nr:hypothetical protein [Photobacterium leiognathi]
MALEVPVVCSDIPVFKEIAATNVKFFSVNSSESLSESIVNTLGAENDNVIFNKEFTVEKMTSKYIKIYEE